MKKMMKMAFATGIAMSMMSIPVFADEISVVVNISDLSAYEAGLEGASETGSVLADYVVTVEEGTAAVEALKQALADNGIDYDIQASDYGTYISSVNGLGGYANPSAEPDYSGWMLEYNHDGFTNWGIDYVGPNGDGIVGDGDILNLQYSLYMGADLGTATTPSLTSLVVGDKELTFEKVFKGYDDTYAPMFDYLVDGEAASGNGTAEDPFVVSVDLGEVEDTNVTVAATASGHYQVVDLPESFDVSEKLSFKVSSAYGMDAYYEIVPTFTVAGGDAAEETGDTSAMPLALLMIFAMAVMAVTRKKEA